LFKALKKLSQLSGADFFLYLKVFCLTGFVRMLILMLPFKRIAKYLGNQGEESPREEDPVKMEASQKIGRAIERISRHTVWESKCLVQAITGKVLLRQLDIANTLYLGVRKNENNELLAHAWLRVGPVIITGKRVMEGFKTVSCFGDLSNRKK